MADERDIKGMSKAELADAYAANVRASEAAEHVGRKKRFSDWTNQIFQELKARGVAREVLQRLVDHPHETVRSSANSDIRWLSRPAPPEPAPDPPLPAHITWQCDNLPPPALTGVEIAQRLRSMSPEFCDRLFALALPAIGLWPQRPGAANLATVSRLGGTPVAPPDWQWPIVDDEPLLFVGQINCAEFAGMPGSELLPSSGLLAFFGDHDGLMGCRIEARDIAIYHWIDIERLVPAVAPIAPSIVFPLCELVLRTLIDLPDPHSPAVQNLSLSEEQVSRYATEWRDLRRHGIPDGIEWSCSFSKLLGWPALVQWGDPPEFLRPLRLLLQLDDYCNGEECHYWGGAGGSIYFVIPEDELRAQNFAACEFDIQFT
jgi:uncharacterized protein DUF1963